jgi:hypothetical protein
MLKDWEQLISEEEQSLVETIEIETTEEAEEDEGGSVSDTLSQGEPAHETIEINTWVVDSQEADVKKSTRHSDTDPTQLYLVEIGASPLLTAAEEVHYARLSRKGNAHARNHMSVAICAWWLKLHVVI